MDIQKIEKEPGLLGVTVTLHKEDYAGPLQDSLKEYRKQASLKGFRQGKAPMSIIRKMFGSQVKADVVVRKLQEELFDFLEQEDIDFYGDPLVSVDQEMLDFENGSDTYSMAYELCLAPKLDIESLLSEVSVPRYKVEASEADVKEVIERMRKQSGTREEVEKDIQEEDMIDIKAFELQDGEVKEGGLSTDFMVLMQTMEDEATKASFLGKGVGDKIDFDIWKVEKGSEEYIRKHILHLEEDDEREFGNMFRGEVTRISRITPAAIDQDFFDNSFGKDEVTSLEEASAKMEQMLQEQLDQGTERLLQDMIYTQMIDKSGLEIHEGAVRRLIAAAKEEPPTDKDVENEIKAMKWMIIQRAAAKKYDIEVEEQEVFERIRNQFKQLTQQRGMAMDEDWILDMADKYMEDEKIYQRFRQETLSDKLAELWLSEIEIHDNTVDKDAFSAKSKEFYDSMEQGNDI